MVREARQVRKVVSYCRSASENFYPRVTGVGNLDFFALLNNLPPREARRRIQTVLDLVELDGSSDVPFQRYSEGYLIVPSSSTRRGSSTKSTTKRSSHLRLP